LQDRLESLEKTVAVLIREVRALRAIVDRLDSSAAPRVEPEPPTAVVTPRVEPPVHITVTSSATEDVSTARREAERRAAEVRLRTQRKSLDLESLIGRYGTLALASLTILLGAGAFLSWAIAHGKIGPELRVLLGALGAAAVAVVGWRLRARGSKRFGSTMLALALALVHVDAWGAGPYLDLVSSPVALSVAAAASLALAVLAWVGNEEALFSVGVGGAIVAPFVTSRSSGSVIALLVYGFVVLGCGLGALRGKAWRTAVIVTTAGCWLYVTVASAATHGANDYVRDYPAVFAIAIAVTALLVTGGTWGVRIARSALAALFGTLLAQVFDRMPALDILALAALGTVIAYAAVTVAAPNDAGIKRLQVFTAGVTPLALGFIAEVSVDDRATPNALVALAWAVGAVVAAYLQPAVLSVHVTVAAIASGAALLFALQAHAIASCIAVAAHAATLSVLLRRIRTRLLAIPIALGLTIVTVWTFRLLSDRPLYDYTPFLTGPSLAAAAMSAAWLTVSWNAYRADLIDAGQGTVESRTLVRLAGSGITFFWGSSELGRAYSADISTFLLILYYAVVGVTAIFVGRARGIRVLRHVGLGLAIFAALKAIAEASSLAIGIRVGSYFLAGLFLLAVAYWYRDRESGIGNGESTTPNGATDSP
jgi:uncharacterized membrane protein